MTAYSAETVTVGSEGLTLSIILWRKFRRPYAGVMEKTLEANRGLADLCPVLPLNTVFTIPAITFDPQTTDPVVSLWD